MEREFGEGQGEAYILVGHTHWDHIMGFPFFAPFYQEGNHFIIVSAGQTGISIRDILSQQQIGLHFPVPFERLQAQREYLPFKPGGRRGSGCVHGYGADPRNPVRRWYGGTRTGRGIH